MSVTVLLLAMLTGAALLVAAGYARMGWGVARRDHYPWMAMFALGVAASSATRVAQLLARVPEVGAVLGLLFGSMALLTGLLWVVVVRRMAGQSFSTPWLQAFAALQIGTVLLVWIPGPLFTGAPMLRTDPMGTPYWGVAPGPLAPLLAVAGLLLAVAFVTVAWRYPRDLPERRLLLISTVAAAIGLQTTYLAVSIAPWMPPIAVFSLPLLVIPAGAILAQQTDDANRDLDVQVQQRTAALNAQKEQLQDTLREAERAREAQTRFLANVSHELRTPLTGVLGILDLLRRNPDAPDRRELLGVAHRSGHNLLELINELLDAARIDADMVNIEARDVELRHLIDDLIEAHTPAAQDQGISLVHTIGPGVPQGIRTDPKRLRQILHNLLGNAIKFTRTGGVELEVRLAERTLHFQVLDTGPGLGTTDAEQLFSRFTQADDSTTRVFGGTGLGLSIARDLARLMAGDLTARDRDDRGAAFELTLPWVQTEGPEDPPTPISQTVRPRFNGKVLLVDDDPTNRLVVGQVLRSYGVEVEVAEDGAKALAEVDRVQPDLVLMDCYMPVLDGFEATRALIGRGFERPIIALTASAGSADRQASFDAGMAAHLSKPIVMPELEAVLVRYLELDA